MDLERRITAFHKLGDFLKATVDSIDPDSSKNLEKNELVKGFVHQIKLAEEHNPWFTLSNILHALSHWGDLLDKENLNSWLAEYNFPANNKSLRVGIVMAGNIPLVGFHDFLSVLISGHSVLAKLSSDDKHLLPYLAQYLKSVEPGFKDKIEFTEGRLENFDAVIATGSDNTARYFEYYFRNKPAIIRKNRNSVALLTGNETEEELQNLAEDIFRYYGLGCRNVSKIFVPEDYDFKAFFNGMFGWKDIIQKHKYANNYDYNKAVYLMSEFKFLDNGFLMLKEDANYSSPIATVFYETYENKSEILDRLSKDRDKIQCIVSGNSEIGIPFGETQRPSLDQYADNIDTIKFLVELDS